jgi:hypothetical protein
MVVSTNIQKVVTPNYPGLYMNGVQLVLANKAYEFPGVEVPDGVLVEVQSSPMNAANILVGPIGNPMTIFNTKLLRPGEFVNWQIKNIGMLQALAFAANQIIIVTFENDVPIKYGG